MTNNSTTKARPSPSGIGGWLALLIFMMVYGGGLMLVGVVVAIGARLIGIDSQNTQFTLSTQLIAYEYLMLSAIAIFSAISIYGGWGLYRGQDWSVVSRARVMLWASGPLGVIVHGVILPLAIFGGLDARTTGSFLGSFMMSVLGTSIWTAYLSVSKRVRNTYGYAETLNETNQDGTTPLMIAAMIGKDKKINELIAAGADIDAADERGWTALMFAASRNEIEVVKSLLRLGANAALQNEDHKTAVDIANDHNNSEISELLGVSEFLCVRR